MDGYEPVKLSDILEADALSIERRPRMKERLGDGTSPHMEEYDVDLETQLKAYDRYVQETDAPLREDVKDELLYNTKLKAVESYDHSEREKQVAAVNIVNEYLEGFLDDVNEFVSEQEL